MSKRKIVLSWALLTLLLFTAVATRAEEPACQNCHPDKIEGRYRHEPSASGSCTSCHQVSGSQSHPRYKGSVKLIAEGGALCANCHGSMSAKKFVHTPVAAGECLACHDPHRSSNRGLLRATGAQLCLLCHENKNDRKHVHAPVAVGDCLACHDPHQSDNRYQLKKYGAELCYLCHKNNQLEGESTHAPVAEGECVKCHQPHSSDNRKLLVKPFPEEFYLPYENGQYALCYQCHSSQLVLDERTLSSTNFRNGDRNLHFVHVNMPDHGRSCKVCHDPHSSSQPLLIRRTVPGYGKWDIPINYTKTSTGGTCVVGCHKTKSYERN